MSHPEAERFASGGIIPGYDGGDSVPVSITQDGCLAPAAATGLADLLPAEFVCSYCQRNPPQHVRCVDPFCTCCAGDGG